MPFYSDYRRVANSFKLLQCKPIPGLGLGLEAYRNQAGLVHYHLQSEDPHRACSIAFRTPVSDNTGLAHVLEHSVLCGSKQYPVRDPFFMMLRRSMQTFMNAMTAADCTWYPFATLNEKDFYNLFSVYTDAVFQPHLHQLDIAQEAHRLSLDDEQEWSINGVVYNEMKGDSGDINSILYQRLCTHLLPDTGYRFNSGGEPEAIPHLDVEGVRAFHRQHYHPANACVCTYGDIDVERVQERLEELSLSLAQNCPADIRTAAAAPPLQAHIFTQETHEVKIPPEDSEEGEQCGHLVSAWLWGDTCDPQDALVSDVCEQLLFGHAASPLRHAIESSGLCRSIHGSGYIDYCRNGIMSLEAHGCNESDYDTLLKLIDQSITQIIEIGFKPEEIEAAINHIEMNERYISGDHEPHGLQLCELVMGAWNNKCDPGIIIDTNYCFNQLRQAYAQNPQLFIDTINDRFIAHKQQVILKTCIDPHYYEHLEQVHSDQVQAALDKHGEDFYHEQEMQLQQRQQCVDDPDVLPKLAVSDITPRRYLSMSEQHFIACNGNGLGQLYLSTAFHNTLKPEQLQLLPLFNTCIGQLGYQHFSYQESAIQFHQLSGEFTHALDIWAQNQQPQLALHSGIWGLECNLQAMHDLMTTYLSGMRFDEIDRIKEIAEQSLQSYSERLNSNGSFFASYASMAGCSPQAALRNTLSGIPQIQSLKHSIQQIDRCAQQLNAAHQLVRWSDASLYYMQNQAAHLNSPYLQQNFPSVSHVEIPVETLPRWQAFPIGGTVQYCALSIPAVSYDHGDAAALSIAAYVLSNAYLHTHIREAGGAYGASAYYYPAMNSFSMSTFRDPQLDNTIKAMHAGLDWLRDQQVSTLQLEEAIMSAISDFDRPESPFTEAKRRVHLQIRNESVASWQLYRSQLLQVKADDIQRVSNLYLRAEHAYYSVLGVKDRIHASEYPWIITDPI